MANPVDILIGKKAIEDFDVLIAKTIKAQEEILKLGNDALNASKNISKINTPSGVTANSNNAQNITASLNKQTEALAKTQTQIERLRVAEIKLQQRREKSVDSFTKNEVKQQQALAKSETAYNRIQGSVKKLTQTYQDLAIRRELGGNLTKREEGQLVSLTNRLNLYQTALKKVDAGIQKNQRNVGNYASGWNGLGNSINQITRELPAFTFSAQTGFLALSNNIPILTDEIGKLQRANKELIAQGKPIKSIFSQIAGALFSLQTAMGIGILLFTLYGKEIGNFVTNLFNSEKAINANVESQKKMTEASKEGVRSAQDELVQLKLNLGIAENVTKSYQQRKLAVDTLKETYPDYLKNISDEAILSGQAKEAIEALTTAIINNARAQAAKTKILENATKELDLLDEQKRLNAELIEQNKENISLEQKMQAELLGNSDRNTALTRYNEGTARSLFLKRQLSENETELNNLSKVNNELSDYAIKNTTLFTSKSKAKTKAEKDALAVRYETRKKELELELQVIDRTLNDEGMFYQERLHALELHRLKRLELISLQYNEETRLAKGNNELQKQALSDYHSSVLTEIDSYNAKRKNLETKGITPLGIKEQELDINEELQKSAEKGIEQAEREVQTMENRRKELELLKKATDEYIKSFSDSYLGSIGLGSLDKFFDGTFEKLMDGADTIEKKFAVTFLAITDVAKQAFAFINQASQANFDAEYSRLELQKEVAIKFAGESTTAQEAVNEEYERRRKAIARREAESKKDLAVFNSIINTAQGVTSALSSANIPLAITIGILGAIQTGFIASQEIPQFFDGGTHKGGLMLVNDGKGSNYKETIVTPDGKVINPTSRNVLMDAPKGTQIFNANQTKERDAYLQSFLQERGISMNFQPKEQNGISTNDFNNGISRLERTMSNSSSGSIVADKKGIALWKIENGRRTKVLNNRLYVRK